MWITRARKITILALWAIYGIAVAEMSVRILLPQPLMPRYITGTSWGVRGNIPGAHYSHHTPEVSVDYRINNQGMRADRDFPLHSTPGTCRIAILGDSFLMGYELQIEQTVASVLEHELNEHGRRAEVLNFSVSGFGTAEMLLTYRAYVRKFNPDLVLMQWHESDFDDNVRSNLFALHGNELVQVSKTYLPSVELQDILMRSKLYRLIADNSQLYSLLRERAATAVKSLFVKLNDSKRAVVEVSSKEESNRSAGTFAPDSYSIDLTAKLLAQAKEEVAADGRGFVVVDIPVPEGRTKLRSSWDFLPPSVVGSIQVVHGIDTLAPLLSPHRKLYFERGHGHLTPMAASRLGKDLATRLDLLLNSRSCGNSYQVSSN